MTGRTLYGSGKKLAQDFQLTLTVGKRSAGVAFADHGRTGKANFGAAVEAYLSHLAVKDVSRPDPAAAGPAGHRGHVR